MVPPPAVFTVFKHVRNVPVPNEEELLVTVQLPTPSTDVGKLSKVRRRRRRNEAKTIGAVPYTTISSFLLLFLFSVSFLRSSSRSGFCCVVVQVLPLVKHLIPPLCLFCYMVSILVLFHPNYSNLTIFRLRKETFLFS